MYSKALDTFIIRLVGPFSAVVAQMSELLPLGPHVFPDLKILFTNDI